MPWQACSARLIGRSEELEHLHQRVERVRSGAGGGVTLVVGEAGVGKSRLVREASALAKGTGVGVLTGRAVPAGEPYRPLTEALTAALRNRPLPRDDALRPYLPVLAGLLPDALVEGRTEQRGGIALAEAVLRLVTALTRGRGALLVLEDLQWVDPDTLDVLTYLAHAADTASLFVIGTARDEVDTPQPLLDLTSAANTWVIRLGRLTADEVRGVVECCVSGRPPAELVEFAVEHADGLPFLVEETLTGLFRIGALSPDGRLTGPLTSSVPWTFAANVRRRLADLGPAARTVVEAAAVLGRTFDWRLLPYITGLSTVQVLAGLRAAVASGLVYAGGVRRAQPGGARAEVAPPGSPTPAIGERVRADSSGGRRGGDDADPDRTDEADTFRFRHALTCDAVRDELLPPEHRTLARAAAEVVQRRDPERHCDLAARLWAASGDDARAAALYLRAGQQARRCGALHTADGQLTQAAALAADSPELRREAEVALLEVLALTGDTDRALTLGERLLAGSVLAPASRSLSGSDLLVPPPSSLAGGDVAVRLTLVEVAADAGRWDVAAGKLELVDGGGPRAGVLAARLAYARGRPDEARARAEAVLAEASARGDWSAAGQALQVLGRAARLHDLDAARSAFAAAERLGAEHNLEIMRVSALHELGTVDLLVDGSVHRLQQARELAADAGILGLAATLDVQIAAGLLHQDAEVALVHAARSAEVARRLVMDQLQATALFFQAAAHAHLRNAGAMEQCVRDAERLAPDDPDVTAGIWGAVRAQVALLEDDRDCLAECLDRAMELLRRSRTTAPAPTYGLWALVRTLADRDGRAARAEAAPAAVNWENKALLGYAAAVDAGRRRRPREAERAFAEADSALGRRPWWRHRIRLLVAAEALAGEWGDPVRWARESLPAFARRGDDRLASRCRELLRRAGARVPRPGRGDTPVPDPLRAFGVTSREMDVLRLVEQGLTNGAIAQRLVLSPRTVETHVANLVAKTNVEGRTGLAELARSVAVR